MFGKFTRASVAVGCVLGATGLLHAQRGSTDWMTAGYDAQRSSWVRGDGKISPETMAKPGFQFLWKVKLKNTPRQMSSITAPALIDFYIGYRGFRTLGFFGGSANSVTGIDTDIAVREWEKTIAPVPASPGTVPCPGGMTSAVTRPTNTGYPPAAFGRGGRGTPAKSGVGAPFEGAVTLQRTPPPAPPPPPPVAASARRTAPPPNPFAPRAQVVLAIDSEGKLHSMYLSNGEEPNAAVPFLPANANAQGLIAFDNHAYAASVNGCAGVPDGIWSIDLADGKVSSWRAPEPMAGSAGPAVSPEGVFYVTSGSKILSVSAAKLETMNSLAADAKFATSALVFEHRGKDYVAAATADGRIHIANSSLERVAMGPAGAAPAAGAMASWQDAAGTRWFLLPVNGTVKGFRNTNGAVASGAITAWKMVEQDGKLSVEPGWVSRDMVSPLTPIVVNGVVFAVSSGQSKRVPAVLYAIDSLTGRATWNSGSTIAGYVTTGGMASGGGRVYVGGHDGMQYAFGMPMEH